jgi:hypothetical protein
MGKFIKAPLILISLCLCINTNGERITGIYGELGPKIQWEFHEETGMLLVGGAGKIRDFYYGEEKPWEKYKEKIKSITLNHQLEGIGAHALSGHKNLEEIRFMPVERDIRPQFSIGDGSLQENPKLRVVTIPNKTHSISTVAFGDNASIKYLIIENIEPTELFQEQDGSTLAQHMQGTTIYVPKESLEKYKKAYGWKDFAEIKTIDEIPKVKSVKIELENRRYLIGEKVYPEYSIQPKEGIVRTLKWWFTGKPNIVVDECYELSGSFRIKKEGTEDVQVLINGSTYSNEAIRDTFKIIGVEKFNENANLKEVKADFAFTPAFSPDIDSYTAEVESNVKTAKVEVIPEDKYAKVTGGYETLKDGENRMEIKVTAENGNVETYYFFIYRISGEARIKSLYTNQGSLTPAFTPHNKEYTIKVTRQNPIVMLVPTPMYEKAKVQTIEDEVSKDTTYNLVCTAEDGKTKETYQFKIEILNDNASLKRLGVKDHELIPEFDPFITNYDVEVPDGTREIFIEAEPQDSNAELSGHPNWNQIQGRETIFNVHVKAQDRYSERTYWIHVKYESITTAVKRPAWDYEETVMIYTIDGRYLGTAERYNKKIIIPDWLGHGIFIAKGSKYREKFTN